MQPPGDEVPDSLRAALAGLVSLARHCIHLEHLEVAIDMRIVPIFDEGWHPLVSIDNPRSRLTNESVGYGRVRARRLVGGRVFPVHGATNKAYVVEADKANARRTGESS